VREPKFHIGTVRCEHCDATIGSFRDGKLKITVRSRLVAIRNDGFAETRCPECKSSTVLPLVAYNGSGGKRKRARV